MEETDRTLVACIDSVQARLKRNKGKRTRVSASLSSISAYILYLPTSVVGCGTVVSARRRDGANCQHSGCGTRRHCRRSDNTLAKWRKSTDNRCRSEQNGEQMTSFQEGGSSRATTSDLGCLRFDVRHVELLLLQNRECLPPNNVGASCTNDKQDRRRTCRSWPGWWPTKN